MGNMGPQISSPQRNSFVRPGLVGPQLPPSVRQQETIKNVSPNHLSDQMMAADSPEPLPPGVDSLPPPPLPPLTPNVNDIGKVASSLTHQQQLGDRESNSGTPVELSPKNLYGQQHQEDVDGGSGDQCDSSPANEQSTERYRPSALLSNILKSSTVQQQDEHHQHSSSHFDNDYRGDESPTRRTQRYDKEDDQYNKTTVRSPRHNSLVNYYDQESPQRDSRDSSPHRQYSRDRYGTFEYENNKKAENSCHEQYHSRQQKYDEDDGDLYNNKRTRFNEGEQHRQQQDSTSAFAKLSESLKLLQQQPPQQQQQQQQPMQQLKQQAVVEPRPDLKPVIDRLAEYVAKNGNEFEDGIKEKKDPRFDFLNSWNVYHGYYLQMKGKAVQVLEKEKLEGSYSQYVLHNSARFCNG